MLIIDSYRYSHFASKSLLLWYYDAGYTCILNACRASNIWHSCHHEFYLRTILGLVRWLLGSSTLALLELRISGSLSLSHPNHIRLKRQLCFCHQWQAKTECLQRLSFQAQNSPSVFSWFTGCPLKRCRLHTSASHSSSTCHFYRGSGWPSDKHQRKNTSNPRKI